jgi:2-amino-4-hydroxy-6-hydroxymethyldihydropteridine diphosphokinase
MAHIYISIGSNIDAERNIRIGVRALQEEFGDLTLSSVYESEAVGFDGDNFLNMVVGLDAEEDIHQVAKTLHKIEDENGRTRTGPRFSKRTLDLDLLICDDLILHEAHLEIPRNEIIENAFVLWPLAEIAPLVEHPIEKKTIKALWDNYPKSRQSIWQVPFTF